MIEVNKVNRWVHDPKRNRGRTRVMHEARLGDLTIDGVTAAEAKTKVFDAARQILSGTYTPVVIRHGRWLAIITRAISGDRATWGYQLLDLNELDGRKVLYSSVSDTTRDEVERRALSHMAQNVFDIEHPYAGLELLTHADDRRQYLSDATFQLRYRALVDAGFDGMVHETASGLFAWPDHIVKPIDLTDPQLTARTG